MIATCAHFSKNSYCLAASSAAFRLLEALLVFTSHLRVHLHTLVEVRLLCLLRLVIHETLMLALDEIVTKIDQDALQKLRVLLNHVDFLADRLVLHLLLNEVKVLVAQQVNLVVLSPLQHLRFFHPIPRVY